VSRPDTFQALTGGDREWFRDVDTTLATRPPDSGSLSGAFAGIAAAAANLGARCVRAREMVNATTVNAYDRERFVDALSEITRCEVWAHGLANGARFVADDERVTATSEAARIIRGSLPRDDCWHPAAPILRAIAAAGISQRTGQRAAKRIGVEHRRAAVKHAPSLWRWLIHPTSDGETASREHSPNGLHTTDIQRAAMVAARNGTTKHPGRHQDDHDPTVVPAQ